MDHKYTETTEINFSQLKERLFSVHQKETIKSFYEKFLVPILESYKKPKNTLIMATGGSKAVAYYLKLFLESHSVIVEVIEPRDYFYKDNIGSFDRLIVISYSGKTNGMEEALHHFSGEKYLITGSYEYQKEDFKKDECLRPKNEALFQLINWNSISNINEKSFISLINTLAPMILILSSTMEFSQVLSKEKIELINQKIKILIEKAERRIERIKLSFQDINLIQIMSGYDTKVSSTILESNLTESGSCSVVIHDKGSFCHGRSNLLYQNPNSSIIYLMHHKSELDDLLLKLLIKEYPNILLLHTLDEEWETDFKLKGIAKNHDIFWEEFYLSLQMYYLSRKIATDKHIDLTMPNYQPNLVRNLYHFRGEM